MKLRIETAGENPPTACECCGNVTNAVWGYVYEGDDPIAAYFVHWTSSKADHYANFDFLVGTWGTDSVNDKELISFIYKPLKLVAVVLWQSTVQIGLQRIRIYALSH